MQTSSMQTSSMQTSSMQTSSMQTSSTQSVLADQRQDPEGSMSGELSQEDKESFLVRFEANDSGDPRNFSPAYKIWIAFQMSLLTTAGTLGAAIMTPASSQIAEYAAVSSEATSLVVALFMLGWAFGPLIWAPISETYGRRMGMLPAVLMYSIFSVATATSTNATSIFLTRFFGGIFASAPISNVPASLGDIYAPSTRGTANAFVTLCISGGLTIGPVIGSAVTVNSRLGWRWTQYILAICVFSIFMVCLVCLPETYPPVILKRRAQQTRKRTGDARYWHPHEKEKISLQNAVTKYFSRPVRLLATEPIVTCLAFYAAYTYGLLYLTVEVVPMVFREQRQWRLVTSTLPFLGMLVGLVVTVIIILVDQVRYKKAVKRNGGNAVPEARLPTMLIGGVFLTTGLFWFGWTAAPEYHWVHPVVAAGFIEAGFDLVYFQCVNFLVDVYSIIAASAVAAITILRSILACGLATAARPMFDALGVSVACSILGAVSCLALPIPLLLMKYNGVLVRRSKMATGS
ncbi:hypothetical protein FE257_002547 [Aspergillus nanangensis]|uniref:Major facilitator superfamily (MFS) profile domain-containing protein n=1 Tax=Aspergillus nanangensis TaxID=2582783 RepID=A0AAD4CSZ0_ASPNN|nr:hypothetical protein FE257_002547 [Aspergillus nanangensis]